MMDFPFSLSSSARHCLENQKAEPETTRLINTEEGLEPFIRRQYGRCCCSATFYQINELLDNALSPAEEAAIRTHIVGCPACAHEYRALEATMNLLRYYHSAPATTNAECVCTPRVLPCALSAGSKRKKFTLVFADGNNGFASLRRSKG